jgi:hypothetical protein
LVTFLNDGVRPETKKETTFLICEVNGPREITTKVVTESELIGNPVKDLIEVL